MNYMQPIPKIDMVLFRQLNSDKPILKPALVQRMKQSRDNMLYLKHVKKLSDKLYADGCALFNQPVADILEQS